MDRKLIKIQVKVPATVANLGAGYDCLALALELHNTFQLYCAFHELPSDEKEYEFSISGKYGEVYEEIKGQDVNKFVRNMKTRDTNLFVKAFHKFRNYICQSAGYEVPRCPILVHQEISVPPLRGLGSSATASVAGVLAAIKFIDYVYPKLQTKQWLKEITAFRDSTWESIIASLAMDVDDCPDNVCASISGGLTYSFYKPHQEIRWRDDVANSRAEWNSHKPHQEFRWGYCPVLHYFHDFIDDPDLTCIALIPTVSLDTPDARRRLKLIDYKIDDVAFNISRSTCLPAVLKNKRYSLLRHITEDKIHQQQRNEELFKDERKTLDLPYVFDSVLKKGAYAAFIGGAGSALIALADIDKANDVAEEFKKAFNYITSSTEWSVDDVLILPIDNQGAACELKEDVSINDNEVVNPWYELVSANTPLSRDRNSNELIFKNQEAPKKKIDELYDKYRQNK